MEISDLNQKFCVYAAHLPLEIIRLLERRLELATRALTSNRTDSADLLLSLAEQHALIGNYFCAQYCAQLSLIDCEKRTMSCVLAFLSSLFASCAQPELADEYRRRTLFSGFNSTSLEHTIRVAAYLASSYLESKLYSQARKICIEARTEGSAQRDDLHVASRRLQLTLIEIRACVLEGDTEGASHILEMARTLCARVESPVAKAELEGTALMLEVSRAAPSTSLPLAKFRTRSALLAATQQHLKRRQLCEWMLSAVSSSHCVVSQAVVVSEMIRADLDLLRLRTSEELAMARRLLQGKGEERARIDVQQSVLRAELNALEGKLNQRPRVRKHALAENSKAAVDFAQAGIDAATRSLSASLNTIRGGRSVVAIRCTTQDNELAWQVVSFLRRVSEFQVVEQLGRDLIVCVSGLGAGRLRHLMERVRFKLARSPQLSTLFVDVIKCGVVSRNQTANLSELLTWLLKLQPLKSNNRYGYLVRSYPGGRRNEGSGGSAGEACKAAEPITLQPIDPREDERVSRVLAA